MTFEEILDHAIAMLQRRRRLTYRSLKRHFQLDDAALDDLKVELIKGQRLATDEDGEVLVWIGNAASPPPPAAPASPTPPLAYTPRHLAERILAEQQALEARGAPDGERKTITALFADIKGSMDLLEDLDPEEARHLVDPTLGIMMDAVHRYEGYVAQSLGDGIFALFGAPIAHEDHAQRALYAALRMQEDMRRYADRVRLERGAPAKPGQPRLDRGQRLHLPAHRWLLCLQRPRGSADQRSERAGVRLRGGRRGAAAHEAASGCPARTGAVRRPAA
jgi:hypothetical protein